MTTVYCIFVTQSITNIMKTTTALNYQMTKEYAINLFNTKSKAYTHAKKTESIFILTALDTALRVSDILKLKYSDIQLDEELNKHVVNAYVAKKKRFETKLLSDETYRLLKQYKDFNIEKNNGFTDYIFMNPKNEKLYSRQYISKRLNKAYQKNELTNLKLKNVGSHSLRRTSAQNVYKKSNDLRVAQYLLGHERLRQTEHYLKLHETQALDKLSKLI